MKEDTKTTEFYARLREQLEGDTQWPSPYLFKFIVPANENKVAEIKTIFEGIDAEIITRDSSKGKYTSISAKVSMKSPDAVIDKYREVSSVEGVISL